MSSTDSPAGEDISQKTGSVGNGGSHSNSLQRLAYSVAEAAVVSSLSRSKLYELLATGELRSIKISGRRLIRRQDILDLLQVEAE